LPGQTKPPFDCSSPFKEIKKFERLENKEQWNDNLIYGIAHNGWDFSRKNKRNFDHDKHEKISLQEILGPTHLMGI
jgi:hypothetical protein